MSRLSDLYKAMETLRKEGLSLNEDLEKQVSDLEENIIKKEILPIVTETIASALKQVQRELVLIVVYLQKSENMIWRHQCIKANLSKKALARRKDIPKKQH